MSFSNASSLLTADTSDQQRKHIVVCICTYKRPELLKRLLTDLGDQDTEGLFTYSVVIVDNDSSESARPVADDFSTSSMVPVRYCIEPKQNIALARNRAVENAAGDFIAFIDDDEFPIKSWLITLYKACLKYDSDGILGPVKPHFDETAPKWIVKSRLYDRPTHPTGFVIKWRMGRTGNVLLKKRVFETSEQPFRAEFLTGEDQDFYRRMIEKGFSFVWCDEAVAYEVVPPIRWQYSFLLKRALFRGKHSLSHPTSKARSIAKSIVAVPAYTLALPFALILGRHRFMTCMVKLFDHLGKLLTAVGIDPVRGPYITQ